MFKLRLLHLHIVSCIVNSSSPNYGIISVTAFGIFIQSLINMETFNVSGNDFLFLRCYINFLLTYLLLLVFSTSLKYILQNFLGVLYADFAYHWM